MLALQTQISVFALQAVSQHEAPLTVTVAFECLATAGVVLTTVSCQLSYYHLTVEVAEQHDFGQQTARGWPHSFRLQHPEGVDTALGALLPRWYADLCQDFDHARDRSQF